MATAAPGGFIPLTDLERADAAGFGSPPKKSRSEALEAARAARANATPEQKKAWAAKAAATRAKKKAGGASAPAVVIATPGAAPMVVAAPAAAPRRRRSTRAARPAALVGALALRAELRKHKRGSKAYMALRKQIRAARKPGKAGRGFKRIPLRRKPLHGHHRKAAAKPAGVVERARRFLGGKAPRAAKPHRGGRTRNAKTKTALVVSPGAAPVLVETKRPSRTPAKPKEQKGYIARKYDKHPKVVKAAAVTAGAVSAVALNRRFPEGVNLKVVQVEASAVAAVATAGGALLAKALGFKRTASTLAYVTVGEVVGTGIDMVAKGKPLLKPGGA
jgi:hypothetical protein